MATIDLGKVAFVWKGTYNSGTTYEEKDVVQYTDSGELSSYIYVNASSASGQTPSTGGTVNTTYWSKMAGGTSLSVGNNKIITTDGSGLVSSLAIGSAGEALKVNSGANGFEFGSVGGLVQTVLGVNTTGVQQGGTTYNITIAEGQITPTSASNIIIGIATSHGSVTNSNGSGVSRDSFFRINREISGGANTQIQETSQRCERNVGGDDIPCMATMVFRDSPNTTSAIDYKMHTKGEGGGWDTFWNQNSSAATMLLMEVKV
jgi:hypothetical protein